MHLRVLAACLAVSALPLFAADAPSGATAPASPGAADSSHHLKGPTPLHISHGAEVNLADYVVPGKTVIFDFYSEYCPPCREFSPHLDRLHAKRADLVVVKIDINRPEHRGIDWESPVAHQYSLQSIPHFTIVNASGKVVADGDEATKQVVGWIQDSEQM